MFKKQFLLFIILLAFIFVAKPVLAEINIGVGDVDIAAGKAGYNTDTDPTTLAKTIGTVIYYALSLAGSIFLVLMIYAGYLWMTAGDSDRVNKAKKWIVSAVIGLAIIFSAYAITSFVLSRATGNFDGQNYWQQWADEEGESRLSEEQAVWDAEHRSEKDIGDADYWW